MNVFVLVRALGAVALPVAFGAEFLGRRNRSRGAHAPARRISGSVGPRPTRRQLRSLVDPQDLRRFDLWGADLRHAPLAGSDLTGLDLCRARLRHNDLRGTNLQYAVLDYADLSGADLRGADLHGSSLLETDLGGADLRGADLRGTRQLPMANLRGAVTDRTTRWPSGFGPPPGTRP